MLPEVDQWPRVSVIIPVYQASLFLERCLHALFGQDYPRDKLEVIAVDNGSIDDSITILQRYPLTLAHCTIRGPAAARNKGISIATGDLILFIDSDCICQEGFIKAHVQAHQTAKNQNQALIIGGGIAGQNSSFWALCDDFCSWYRQHPRNPQGYVDHAPTANMSIRATNLSTLGGFDEELRFGEDYAFCQKAINAGYAILFYPKATIKHINRSSFKHFIKHSLDWKTTQDLLKDKGIVPTRIKSTFILIIYYLTINAFMTLEITTRSLRNGRLTILLCLPFIILNISLMNTKDFFREHRYQKSYQRELI